MFFKCSSFIRKLKFHTLSPIKFHKNENLHSIFFFQIDLFIQTVINNCTNVTQLNKDAPVALVLQSEPPHLTPYLSEIRICISILFSFQRKLIRETQFIKETRTWLTQLVAVLLRVANFQDHLFILNHILR